MTNAYQVAFKVGAGSSTSTVTETATDRHAALRAASRIAGTQVPRQGRTAEVYEPNGKHVASVAWDYDADKVRYDFHDR